MGNRESTGLDEHQKAFIKLIKENARRHRMHEVFRDFCEIAAISFSNACDHAQRASREARYMHLIKRYEREELERFAAMIGCVMASLQGGFHDCLGQLFMALELGDHWKGQFFTPYHVAYLMAQLVGVDAEGEIKRKGFTTLMEPACGAGCMVIATANAMLDAGINYQHRLHVTAIDIDETAAHMAYIQFSLLNIPAIVVHGNALTPDKSWSSWLTLAHVMGGWDRRLQQLDMLHALAELMQPCPAEGIKSAHEEAEAPADEPPTAALAAVRSGIVAARVAQLDLF